MNESESESEVTQSCLTLCDPMDCSPPGSVHGILQARILEWVAISFSRGSSQPRDRTQVSRIAGRFFTGKDVISSVQFSCSVVAILSFPHGSNSKKSACNAGDLGSIPRLGRSLGRGHGNPFQYSCLENPHGQKSLAGYKPWDGKELDSSEQLST